MPTSNRINRPEREILKSVVFRLTTVAKRLKDLDTKDKIERAAALVIQALITANFKPNSKDLFEED